MLVVMGKGGCRIIAAGGGRMGRGGGNRQLPRYNEHRCTQGIGM
jgi:hypothetical protein